MKQIEGLTPGQGYVHREWTPANSQGHGFFYRKQGPGAGETRLWVWRTAKEAGMISASKYFYQRSQLVGCFAHVNWHFSHGKLLNKDHAKFLEIQLMLPELNTCHTVGMCGIS